MVKKYYIFLLFGVSVCFGYRRSRTSDGSCVGICGDSGGSVGCYCNLECSQFEDCCSDYSSVCYSCQSRCGEGYDADKPCQCNKDCLTNDDCCDDYNKQCQGGVTDDDIIALTEELFSTGSADFVGTYITFDINPPGPLFTNVDSEALQGATIQSFLQLRSDYDPYTSQEDNMNSQDKDAFLDAVMATNIMTSTEDFLTENGYITDSLRSVIDEIFFTPYPRYGSTLGSSGFEHSFMGDIDDGQVKGFHNWISMYKEEQAGHFNYTSYQGETAIDNDINLLKVGFTWYNYTKSSSTLWVGSTPEFELAYYTICFLYKPNSLCDVSSNGIQYQVQTYTQDYDGKTLVGSAYPNF